MLHYNSKKHRKCTQACMHVCTLSHAHTLNNAKTWIWSAVCHCKIHTQIEDMCVCLVVVYLPFIMCYFSGNIFDCFCLRLIWMLMMWWIIDVQHQHKLFIYDKVVCFHAIFTILWCSQQLLKNVSFSSHSVTSDIWPLFVELKSFVVAHITFPIVLVLMSSWGRFLLFVLDLWVIWTYKSMC